MRVLLTLAVLAFYALHQDLWFWRSATPLVFGVLPIGLFYHVCYVACASALMWLLVAYAWPSHLEKHLPPDIAVGPPAAAGGAEAARAASRTRG